MIPDISLYDHYDICVIRGGGDVITRSNSNRKLFDIASLTKAVVHILICELAACKQIDLKHKISSFIEGIKNPGDRTVLDFLRFTVQSYRFDYASLKTKPFDGDIDNLLISEGFQTHLKQHRYDNVASVFLGILLKRIACLPNLQDAINYFIDSKKLNIVFHPDTELIVNGQPVHDPFVFMQRHYQLATAGIFSDAEVVGRIFYKKLTIILEKGFYKTMSSNVLDGVDNSHKYAMGFDIPYLNNPVHELVENPLVFAGYTGCRIFFGIEKKTNKLIVICILTDRVHKSDTPESRMEFSKHFWSYVISVLNER